jgi:hypothetical protein
MAVIDAMWLRQMQRFFRREYLHEAAIELSSAPIFG